MVGEGAGSVNGFFPPATMSLGKLGYSSHASNARLLFKFLFVQAWVYCTFASAAAREHSNQDALSSSSGLFDDQRGFWSRHKDFGNRLIFSR